MLEWPEQSSLAWICGASSDPRAFAEITVENFHHTLGSVRYSRDTAQLLASALRRNWLRFPAQFEVGAAQRVPPLASTLSRGFRGQPGVRPEGPSTADQRCVSAHLFSSPFKYASSVEISVPSPSSAFAKLHSYTTFARPHLHVSTGCPRGMLLGAAPELLRREFRPRKIPGMSAERKGNATSQART